MRSATSELVLHQPRTLEEALRRLRDDGPLTPIAGCTDVYVGLNAGAAGSAAGGGGYLDLLGLRELRFIRPSKGGLVLGALATWTDLRASPVVLKRLPMLVDAARRIGGVQIQNRGTLGGNVANGSPAGDALPVLLAADATVVIRSAAAERRVPFAAYYVGYRKSVLRADELITAFEIPPVAGRQWFRKVGTRAAQAISKVVVAGVRGKAPRFALGSVGPTPLRALRTEAALAAGASLEEAQRILNEEIAPIDDVRSTASYRRRVAGALLRRFWIETAGR